MSTERAPQNTSHVVSVVGIVGVVMMALAVLIPTAIFVISVQSRSASPIPPPLSYRNLPFPTVHAQVAAGEVVDVVVDRCNASSMALTFSLTRSLIDTSTGAETVLPEEKTTATVGCSAVISTLTTIPRNTKPGNYYITYLARAVGRAWTHDVPSRTVVFEVISP